MKSRRVPFDRKYDFWPIFYIFHPVLEHTQHPGIQVTVIFFTCSVFLYVFPKAPNQGRSTLTVCFKKIDSR